MVWSHRQATERRICYDQISDRASKMQVRGGYEASVRRKIIPQVIRSCFEHAQNIGGYAAYFCVCADAMRTPRSSIWPASAQRMM